MGKGTFKARFWGARGTLASIASDTLKYGGNTACVEIICGDRRLIMDAGSGLRRLGDVIMSEGNSTRSGMSPGQQINLFFTHCHYDHISGLPFFAPFFEPTAKINIWSGHLEGPDKTERMIKDFMSPPFFPVGPEVFLSSLEYHDFEPHDILTPARGIVIKTLPLNHHGGCIGYRVEYDGRSICYITDTTHVVGEPDQGLVDFIKDADLVIYDATYTDEEFPRFWNFGHSTWEEGVRLCKAAGVKRYCLFHHRPSRNDKALDQIADECKQLFNNSWIGQEGLTIEV